MPKYVLEKRTKREEKRAVTFQHDVFKCNLVGPGKARKLFASVHELLDWILLVDRHYLISEQSHIRRRILKSYNKAEKALSDALERFLFLCTLENPLEREERQLILCRGNPLQA